MHLDNSSDGPYPFRNAAHLILNIEGGSYTKSIIEIDYNEELLYHRTLSKVDPYGTRCKLTLKLERDKPCNTCTPMELSYDMLGKKFMETEWLLSDFTLVSHYSGMLTIPAAMSRDEADVLLEFRRFVQWSPSTA